MGSKKNDRSMTWVLAVLVACALGAVTSPVLAEGDGSSLTALEYSVFGGQASTTLRQSDFGGGEFARGDEQGRSFSNLGGRFKAGLLSMVLPGAGQYYNGDRRKALVFGAAEAAIWTSWYVFDRQGDNRTDTFIEYAEIHADTDGTHNESYWQNVASYMNSEDYNEKRLRNARAEGTDPTMLVADVDAWQWQTHDDLQTFQQLRGDAIRAYDRRDFVILFFVVNRAIAVFDAMKSYGPGDISGPEVLGFKVDVDVEPSLQNLGAKCTFSHAF